MKRKAAPMSYDALKAKLGIAPAKRPALFTLDPEMGAAKAESPYIGTDEKKPKAPPITEDLSRFILEKNKTQLWWSNMSPAERKRQCAKRRANALKRRKE